MSRAQIVLVTLLAITGCDTINKVKVDNPVVGEPPPRLAPALAPAASTEDETADATAANGITQASYTSQADPPSDALADTQVVATVNGSPIFAGEILERYELQLSQAREKAPPEQYRQIRTAILKRDLRAHIERKLLINSLKSSLQKEQLEQINGHLDQMWEKEIDRLKKELKINSKHELEIELKKQKTSLDQLREQFENQRLAGEYLSSKSEVKGEIGREELLNDYQTHLEDYAVAAQVRWQQIAINHAKHGGKDGAFEVVEKLVAELKNGKGFSDVAREYSNGPSAKRGGQWSWTQLGSLADKRIEKALFDLPVGHISQVFANKDSFRLVKINERKKAHHIQFKDVQQKIKQKLTAKARREATKNVVKKLFESATVTTIFDDEVAQQATPKELPNPFR